MRLGIVLKITERCNLDCSYCYYFNGIDQSFKSMPARITKEVIIELGEFLKQGIIDLKLTNIKIGFHGGEPMLLKKNLFDWICEYLTNLLQGVKLTFSIQTNGTLIDKGWIDLIKKYNIDLGISIDGPEEYHDEFRVDHKKRGSYLKIAKNIKLLQDENCQFGVLAVINPTHDSKKIYRHFVDALRIYSFDFLFPDFNYDKMPPYDFALFTKFFSDLFDEWTKDDNPEIKIRIFESYMGLLLGRKSLIYGIGTGNLDLIPLLTIRSNGNLQPTDELMSTDPNTVAFTGASLATTSLKDFLDHKIFKEIKLAQANMPAKCSSCCWSNACGGGGIVNRFSKDNRFDNPSIYCDTLQNFFNKVLKYLIESGIDLEVIKNRLLG